MSYILEMIKKGKLCNLSLGLSVAEIETIIKKPNNVLELSEESQLWAYDYGLELYLENDVLNKITLKYDYMNKSFKLPKFFDASACLEFNKLCSIDTLIKILDENDVDWEINKNLCDDTNICLSCNEVSQIFYCLDTHHILSIQSVPVPFWVEQNAYWAKKNNRIG